MANNNRKQKDSYVDDMDLSNLKDTKLTSGLSLNKSPFHVYCKKCGTGLQYDIINQNYRCKACGQTTELSQAQDELKVWRKVRLDSREPIIGQDLQVCSCPTCGANIIFKAKEASEKCSFCGSNVVRAALTDSSQMPDTIIPFKITKDEAKQRFLDWAEKNKKYYEARQVKLRISDLQQYYLPFRLVRGPVLGNVNSYKNNIRNWEIQGFSSTSAISASKQMDNLLLNQIEPFEWNELKPFEYEYIGGLPVMLSDQDDYNITKSMQEEIKDDVLPDIQKQLSCTSPDVDLKFGELLKMNALLPVYIIKSGKFCAVMNGQTGKIAATNNRTQKKGLPWWVEAIAVLLIFALVPYFALGGNTDPEVLNITISIALVFALPFFILMKQAYEGNEALISRIIRKSVQTRALRENGTLTIIEKNKIIENPFSHKTVFMASLKDKNNPKISDKKIPVRMKIFTFWRGVFFILNTININFGPVIIALVVRIIQQGFSKDILDTLVIKSMAAYWCLSVFLTIIYWIKGMRTIAYERPVIYEINPDGKIGAQSSKSFGHNIKLIHCFELGQTSFSFGCISTAIILGIFAFFAWLILNN